MGDARYGRRDNGLVAAQYADAGDVDPRVGEHLLDVLALAGIAAYLRPSSDENPVTRSTVLPKRPIDRLFVDHEHLAVARGYLLQLDRESQATDRPAGDRVGAERPTADRTAGEAVTSDRTASQSAIEDRTATTGNDDAAGVDPPPASPRPGDPTPEEFERAWAQIVAGFGDTAPGTDSSSTGSDADSWRPEPYRQLSRPQRPTRPEPEPSLLDGLDTFGTHLPDEDEGEFVPPAAPPVPRPSLPAVLAVIGVVGGLAVFLKPELLSFLTHSAAMTLGFAAVIAGFGTLVYRLRPGSDEEDDDPDDGARV